MVYRERNLFYLLQNLNKHTINYTIFSKNIFSVVVASLDRRPATFKYFDLTWHFMLEADINHQSPHN